jgi:quinol-cytochrome oxidoreductase complex cytochrome b subunit
VSDIEETKDDSIPFFPDHALTELRVVWWMVGLVVVLGIVGLFFPVGLGPQADPMNTPEHVKPEWYFLALYQLLKYIPKTVGVLTPIIGLILVAIWPFLDRKPDKSQRATRIRLIGSVVFVVILVAMTIWGEVG